MQSHPDVAVHGRKGLFMMNECKRTLNKEVTGEGSWQTDLSKCQGQREGEVLESRPADAEGQSSDKDDQDDEVVEPAVATEDADGEHIDVDTDMVVVADQSAGEAADPDTEIKAQEYGGDEDNAMDRRMQTPRSFR